MLEVDAGAATVGGELDLDGAGTGRQVAGVGLAPADEQPVRRVEVQEAAADRRPGPFRSACSSRHAARQTWARTRRSRRAASILSLLVTRPIVQAAFRKLGAVAVLTGLLLPRPSVPPKGRGGSLPVMWHSQHAGFSDEQNSSRERESVAIEWHPCFQKGWS